MTNMKKTAIVTGAAKGIGLGIAKEFCARGYQVYGTYVSDYTKEELAVLEEDGFRLIKSDVADPEACRVFVDEIMENTKTIDVLVNNAGMTRDRLLLRMNEEDFESVLKTNLAGAFHMIKAVMKPMIKKRWGRIINISSVVGLAGNAGQTNYAASKAGLIGFSKSAARELAARNITVNCVAPGFIRTEMTDILNEDIKNMHLASIPLKRFGEVSDVAKAVAFLASDDAGYITGQVINVCGGMVMN